MKSEIKKRVLRWAVLGTAITAIGAAPAKALVVTQDTVAASLAAALTSGAAGGITVTGATLSGQTGTGTASSGTYTNVSGTYGIGDGIILSSGNVSNYGDGPNTSRPLRPIMGRVQRPHKMYF